MFVILAAEPEAPMLYIAKKLVVAVAVNLKKPEAVVWPVLTICPDELLFVEAYIFQVPLFKVKLTLYLEPTMVVKDWKILPFVAVFSKVLAPVNFVSTKVHLLLGSTCFTDTLSK